ncbi:MAG: hypothetical protein ACLTQU_08765, partial [Enterococcus casseliflavus]
TSSIGARIKKGFGNSAQKFVVMIYAPFLCPRILFYDPTCKTNPIILRMRQRSKRARRHPPVLRLALLQQTLNTAE